MIARNVPNRRGGIRQRRGVTLVELLIVVTVLGILVGLVVSRYEPGVPEQLQSAAQVVASDVSYCRSLAVANNSLYRLTFDVPSHRYWLEHSGANAVLNTLPPSPFRLAQDAATRQTTDLKNLPSLTVEIELVALRKVGSTSEENATSIEFDSLGAMTQSERAVIWLAAGSGDGRRYLAVSVNPVTGIAELGDVQLAPPPAAAGP